MCVVALSAIGYRAVADQPDPYWENPEMFAENKLPAKATFTPYLTTEAATERGDSELVMDISGEWRFNWHYYPKYTLHIPNIYAVVGIYTPIRSRRADQSPPTKFTPTLYNKV